MSNLKPIIIYKLGPTANPWKVTLIIEELNLPYEHRPVQDSELKQEPYILLNPNGRTPAMVDPNNNDLVLWEVSRGGRTGNTVVDTDS